MELEQVHFQPVFILGVHRSGTSILYKMLTATGSFNPVTAYHLINYHELLTNHLEKKEQQAKQQLTASLRNEGLVNRGIDQLQITADFAEEYGFLLRTETIQMYINRKNVALVTQLCKKIQYIAGNEKPILLKNPYDFANFLYLKETFPNAKFIFIHRHPLKTISSTLNAVRTLLQEKNPYTIRLSHVYEQCYRNPLSLLSLRFLFNVLGGCCVVVLARITKKSTDYFLRNIKRLPKDDYISITYEDFCVHPQEIIQQIMETFSISIEQHIDAAVLMKPRSVKVDRAVHKFRRSIYRSMKEYCDLYHYSTDI